MESALDGGPGVWSYSGLIYAIQPGERPRPILALAGGSSTWAARRPDGSWELTGATLSFFADPDSKAFLDTFANPFTGARDAVKPNFLSGGAMIVPADGGAPSFRGVSRAGQSAPKGFAPDAGRPLGRVEWIETGDSMSMITDHAFSVRMQPQIEARTIFADRRAFFDPAVRRLPARFATTTVTPWLGWMDMGDRPGHLVWHCSGEKYFAARDLPAIYRARAGSLLAALDTPPAP